MCSLCLQQANNLVDMEEPWSFTAGAKSSQKRARFNLLALDHGEYYFQDYSAFFYPPSGVATATATASASPTAHHRPKQQGRLKLCSRGLLFEPADRLSPLVRYPFRHMETQMEPTGSGYGGGGSGWGGHSRDGAREQSSTTFRNGGSSGGVEGEAFRFRCTVVVESRKNDEATLPGKWSQELLDSLSKLRVGPYVMKRAGGSGAAGEWNDWIFMFSLLHTPLGEFLTEARRLREVALRVKERGHGYEEPLLRPILEERLRDSTRKFDTIHLVDFRETLLLPTPVRVDRITPLLRNPGCIMVTDVRVYFQPAELNNVGERVASFDLSGVVRVFKRRHMLRQTGLELFMEGDEGSAFFNFESSRERDELFDVLMSQPLVGQRAQSARDIEAETRRWQAGQVSNYDYLVFLNTIAGRTVNDLTQYPVFPWVLKDFDSPTLNLDDPWVYSEVTGLISNALMGQASDTSTLHQVEYLFIDVNRRDLSQPIGALNAERLEYFRTRLRNMPDPALHPGQGYPPPFLYGTHYSTPGYALFFLVRAAPEEMLCLQNGRFDDPDRSFTSVKGAWESVLNNHADLKELIPEFYAGDGSFLTNVDDLQLGVTQGGQRVGDVELPPWARNPRDFVRKMRRALESPHVSRRLHLWIDLIFGCRQRGKAAVDADNLFYYLTYEGSVDLEKIDDPRERAALESQISEFGQCPSLLFRGPHPCRDAPVAPILVAPPFGKQRHLGSRMRKLPGGRSGKGVDGGSRGSEGGGDVAVMTAPPGGDQMATSTYASGGGGAGGGADVVPCQPPGQAWQGMMGASQSRRRSESTSPYSPPSSPAGLMGGGLTVGSSVGALWKRGLAMAGVVSATAEPAGARGGFNTLQERQGVGARDPLGGVEADREVLGQHVVGSDGLTHTSSLPPPPSAPDEEIDRVERSRSVPDRSGLVAGHDFANRIRASQHETRYVSHEGVYVHDGAADGSSGMSSGSGNGSSCCGVGLGIGNPDGALESESAPTFNAPEPGGTRVPSILESNATGSRSSGRNGDAHGSGSGRSGGAMLPPALAGARGTRLWDIDAAKIELRSGEPMALHRDGVTCAHLVIGGAEGDGEVLPATAPPDASSVRSSSAASGIESSLTLCTSSKDCSVKICHLHREAGVSRSVSKAHTRRRLAFGELPVSCCALTRDAKLAVAGSWDNGLLLYSVEAAAVLSKIDGAHEDGIRCLALHDVGGSVERNAAPSRWRDGSARRMLATGSWDAAVKVWDVRASEIDPSPVLELFDLEAAVQALAFDGAGRVLAAAGEDGMVALWDVSTGSVLATFSGVVQPSPIVSINWTPTPRARSTFPIPCVGDACLVLASEEGEVSRWSIVGDRLDIVRLDSEISCMKSDGSCTVVACRDGSVRLLASPDGGGFVPTLNRESGLEGELTCLDVKPCGERGERGRRPSLASSVPGSLAVVAIGSDNGAVRVWDVMQMSMA